jgi:lipopolysaccharide/colanic/teichoic acid biosynthesis glycosyltransferase
MRVIPRRTASPGGKARHAIDRSAQRAGLILWDSLSWAVALLAAADLRYELDVTKIDLGAMPFLFGVAIAAQLCTGVALHVYCGRYSVGSLDEGVAVATSVALAGFAITVVNLLEGQTTAPRSVPMIAVPIAVLLTVGARVAVRLRRERWGRLNRGSAHRVIVYGAGIDGEQLLRLMLSDPVGGLLPVALLDDDPRLSGRRISGVAVRGTSADLARTAAESGADLLVITGRSGVPDVVKSISAEAVDVGLDVRFAPRLIEVLQPLPAELTPPDSPVGGRRPRLSPKPLVALSRTKRMLDLTACLIALPVVLLVLLVAAGVLKVVDGQVLYRAERVGRDGQIFTMYKLATMVGDDGPRVTRSGDPRITRLGLFLRSSKLNELPQVFNVIKGEMSLVGPRPEDPRYAAFYSERQRRVLAARPGMTSSAFLEFGDEERYIERARPQDIESYYLAELLPKKLDIELQYVNDWTVRADLRILALTFVGLLS